MPETPEERERILSGLLHNVVHARAVAHETEPHVFTTWLTDREVARIADAVACDDCRPRLYSPRIVAARADGEEMPPPDPLWLSTGGQRVTDDRAT